jgi:hypothetical protein
MGMIGEYARLTSAELGRAMDDPAWVREFVEELGEVGGSRDRGVFWARRMGVGKSWDALRFLLERQGFPVDVVHGGQELPGAGAWGYGPPRYLTGEEVERASRAMAGIAPAALSEGVAAADLARAEVYPVGLWQRGEPLEFVTWHYRELERFFGAAALRGHSMLLWIG